MMRSLFSGVTGLKSHQTKMDVIGNNIANVNTVGFKSSSVTFSDLFSQTLSSASAPTAFLGGVNARQIGLGTQVSSIKMNFNTGSAQYTGNFLDFCIEGDGFFIVQTADGPRFTRDGSFNLDSAGNLINNSGYFVQGFDTTYVPATYTGGVLDPGTGTFTQNPAANTGALVNINIPYEFFTGMSVDKTGAITLQFKATTYVDPATGNMTTDPLIGAGWDEFAEGDQITFGYIAMANFVNPAGLQKQGENLYNNTANSGEVGIGRAASAGYGGITGSALEMSNVDLAQEFVDMIVTQRGLQANSRIITTSDSILEELVNLKR